MFSLEVPEPAAKDFEKRSSLLVKQITEAYPNYLRQNRHPHFVSEDTGIKYPIPACLVDRSIMHDSGGTDTFRKIPTKSPLNSLEVQHSFVLLHGPQTELKGFRYLMGPAKLGEGEFYQVWGATQFPGGAPVLVRIKKDHVTKSRFDKDVESSEVWIDFPEVPKLIDSGTDPVGRQIIILDNKSQAEKFYIPGSIEKLSIDNLYRLITMQLFALPRWLEKDAVYSDWQEEELLYWKMGVGSGEDQITAFKVMDWQPNCAWPDENGKSGFREKLQQLQRQISIGDYEQVESFLKTDRVKRFLDFESIDTERTELKTVVWELLNMTEQYIPKAIDATLQENSILGFFERRISIFLENFIDKLKIKSYLEELKSKNSIDEQINFIKEIMEKYSETGLQEGNIGKLVEPYVGKYDIGCKPI